MLSILTNSCYTCAQHTIKPNKFCKNKERMKKSRRGDEKSNVKKHQHHVRNKSQPASKKSQRRSGGLEDGSDPFRNAPLPLFYNNAANNSSSSSSNTSSESAASLAAAAAAHQHNAGGGGDGGGGGTSAFQPYKKQADPFISAPFEQAVILAPALNSASSSSGRHRVPTDSSPAGSSSTTSATPTQSSMHEDEIVQVIGNRLASFGGSGGMMASAAEHEQATAPPPPPVKANPFVEAPFTVKKVHKTVSMFSQAGVAAAAAATASSPEYTAANKTPTLFDQSNFVQWQAAKKTTMPTSASLNEIKAVTKRSHVYDTKQHSHTPSKSTGGGGGGGGISNISFEDY